MLKDKHLKHWDSGTTKVMMEPNNMKFNRRMYLKIHHSFALMWSQDKLGPTVLWCGLFFLGLVSVYTWRHDLVNCLKSIFDESNALSLLTAAGVCLFFNIFSVSVTCTYRPSWVHVVRAECKTISRLTATEHYPHLPIDPGFSDPPCFLTMIVSCVSISLTSNSPLIPTPPYLLSLTSSLPTPCSSDCIHVLGAHDPTTTTTTTTIYHHPSLLVSHLIRCYWPSQLCSILPPLPRFLPHTPSLPSPNPSLLLPFLSSSIPVSLPLLLMEWLQCFSLRERRAVEPSVRHTQTHTHS